MHTEWMKVMLEEVARKREEADLGREEEQRRAAERAAASRPVSGNRKEPAPARR